MKENRTEHCTERSSAIAFIPVSLVARFSVEFTIYGKKVSFIIDIKNAAGWTASTLATQCSALDAWVIATLLPHLSHSLTYTGIYAVDLTTATGAYFQFTAVPGNIGGESNDALPNNVAIVVERITGLRGRSFRGRTFVPGIPGNFVVADVVNPTYFGTIVAAMTTLREGIDASGLTQGVVSTQEGGVTLSAGVFTPYTGERYSSLLVATKSKRLRDTHR